MCIDEAAKMCNIECCSYKKIAGKRLSNFVISLQICIESMMKLADNILVCHNETNQRENCLPSASMTVAVANDSATQSSNLVRKKASKSINDGKKTK